MNVINRTMGQNIISDGIPWVKLYVVACFIIIFNIFWWALVVVTTKRAICIITNGEYDKAISVICLAWS